jgi:hypothetical protein
MQQLQRGGTIQQQHSRHGQQQQQQQQQQQEVQPGSGAHPAAWLAPQRMSSSPGGAAAQPRS